MYRLSFFILFILLTINLLAQTDSRLFLEGASITGIKGDGTYIWVSTYGQGIFQYNIKDDKWSTFSTKKENLENDLFYNLDVDLYTSVLGGNVQIQTLDHKTLSIVIPPETDNGKLLKLRGQGMVFKENNSKRGDLFVRVIVQIPKHLSKEEKELFKKLSQLRKD